MLKMIGRRVAIAVLLLLVVSFLVFALTAISPSDPARAILGEGATPASIANLRHQLGLDQPTLQRYAEWLMQLFHGNLGQSWYGNVPVVTKLAQGLPVTATLVLASIVFTAAVALPLGLYAGMRPGGRVDRISGAVAGFLLAMPEFWVVLLLVLILSQKLHVLPGTGTTVITADVWRDIQFLTIPVIAISLPQICALYRQTRASAATVIGQDFIRTARAGGIADGELLRTRVAKNALVPPITLIALQLGRMIGIAAVVESVYGMQGIGSMAVQAALNSDLPVVLGIVLVTAGVVMAANLLADITTYYLAPKARTS
jgi:peptide/nickel transport system permease protein